MGSRASIDSQIFNPGPDLGSEVVEALVIGGGISGVRLTIELKRCGLRSIALLEKSDQLGGVWHHNRYPGVACDIPSSVYCYEMRPHAWTRSHAPGAEIRSYVQTVAAENDVVRHVRFNTELLDAAWDERLSRWICRTNRGRYVAKFLMLASGVLHTKVVPDIAGMQRFAGRIFHSCEWPQDFDPQGRRIAVIGTGASAIQFIPHIQKKADRLVVMQRTPPWVVAKAEQDFPANEEPRRALGRQRRLRWAWKAGLDVFVALSMRNIGTSLVEKGARSHLQKSVADPQLRALLTPQYRIGCKRPLQSNDFYPAITANNVDYVASGLAEIRERSVVAADGREFEVDTIIWGTGFTNSQGAFDLVRGRDGRSMTEVFAGTPRTYRATMTAGFPNAFIVMGPNAGTYSVPLSVEMQSRYIRSAIEAMRRQDVEAIEVRPEAQDQWTRFKDAQFEKSVWNPAVGGCTSYYTTREGINVSVWPGTVKQMHKAMSAPFDMESYVVTRKATTSQADASRAPSRGQTVNKETVQ